MKWLTHMMQHFDKNSFENVDIIYRVIQGQLVLHFGWDAKFVQIILAGVRAKNEWKIE